jgi:hypothetical protein
MFAKLSGQLQGPQHNHLHLHAEVPSREEAIEAARECLEVFAPHLLTAGPVALGDVTLASDESEPPDFRQLRGSRWFQFTTSLCCGCAAVSPRSYGFLQSRIVSA